jgi:DNA-binding transcriptional MerR regulator
MRIGKVAELTGFSASTIRAAERDQLLPPAPRDAANQRRYVPADVPVIRAVLLTKTPPGRD